MTTRSEPFALSVAAFVATALPASAQTAALPLENVKITQRKLPLKPC
jgi:hypothetical protein